MKCDRHNVSERQAWEKKKLIHFSLGPHALIGDVIWHDPLEVWEDSLSSVRRVRSDSSGFERNFWNDWNSSTHKKWVPGGSLAFWSLARRSDCTHGHHCWLETKVACVCLCVGVCRVFSWPTLLHTQHNQQWLRLFVCECEWIFFASEED